ncbi:hypothetical protein Gorai_002842, partial [Gossypium raimondii]|nr:hypothetical protein [Gossypium raimondii]
MGLYLRLTMVKREGDGL